VETDFQKSIELMVQSGVRFVIIGGVAMRLQGSSHVTDDIDFTYSRDPEGLPGLVATLNHYHVRLRGFPADLPFFFDLRTLKNTQNLTLVTDVGDIDLLAEPPGIDSFEGLWERATELDVFGMAVRVASLEDIIAMKQAAGRPKDQQHLLELRDLQQYLRNTSSNPDSENA